jgi:hypothetical protein
LHRYSPATALTATKKVSYFHSYLLQQGEDALTEYRFNKKQIQHLFCKVCGVQSFGRGAKPDGTHMVALNVRCLDGVTLEELTITPVDGKNY